MIEKLETVTEMIRTGKVRLGMTRKEVMVALGAPDDTGGASRKYPEASIYLYGDVQLVFPQARTPSEASEQGLLYVYVDDGTKGLEQPLFLLPPVDGTYSK